MYQSSLAFSSSHGNVNSPFEGYVNGCRYVRCVRWGVSCLKTSAKENQDGWSVNVIATDVKQSGRERGFLFRQNRLCSLSWCHQLCAEKAERLNDDSENTNRENRYSPRIHNESSPDGLAADAISFIVLDGHGSGGRQASRAVEESFNEVYERVVEVPPKADVLLISHMVTLLEASFQVSQDRIEMLNRSVIRDFGTTCVSVTLANDVLIATACGDSSALLFALPHDEKKVPLIIELGRRHHLSDDDEIMRIKREGKGQIVNGDGDVLRLIPASMDYTSAKKAGLSINMSRSLGHHIFKEYGLSTETDYTLLTLGTLPRLLKKELEMKNITKACYRLPVLTPAGCQDLAESYSRGRSGRPFRRTSLSQSRTDVGTNTVFTSGQESNTRSQTVPPESRRCDGIEIKKHMSIDADIFILLLSDGVTDVFSSSCLLELLQNEMKEKAFDPELFSIRLTTMARDRRLQAEQRPDNCTCLIVQLLT